MIPRLSPNDPTWPLYDPQLTPMYMTKMTHKWPLDYPQMTPPGPYDLQLTPMWTHMIKMTPQITLKYNWTAPTLPWWIVLICVCRCVWNESGRTWTDISTIRYQTTDISCRASSPLRLPTLVNILSLTMIRDVISDVVCDVDSNSPIQIPRFKFLLDKVNVAHIIKP